MPKVQYNRRELLAAIQIATVGVNVRNNRPVLTHLKFRVGNIRTEIIGTDTETTVVAMISTGCRDSCEFMFPTGRGTQIINELRGDTVDITVDKASITVESGKSVFRIQTIDPQDFPDFVANTDASHNGHWTVPGSSLKEIIRQAAMSSDREGIMLNGRTYDNICLEFTDTEMFVVATDRRRMSVVSVPCGHYGERPKQPEFSVLLGVKTADMIFRAIPDNNEVVGITIQGNSGIVFHSPEVKFIGRLANGEFMNWRPAIHDFAEKLDSIVAFPRTELTRLMRQAELTIGPETRAAEFAFSSGDLTVKSKSPEFGDSTVSLSVPYSGPDTKLKLDPKFIGDFLKVSSGETVIMKFKNHEYPALFSSDGSFEYLLAGIEEG